MRCAPVRVIVLPFMALTVFGCGETTDSIARQVFPASGIVTYKGKPIPDASIRLHPVNPPDDGKPFYSPRGKVDDNGTYTLSTYTPDDGAPPGEYMVSVSWLGPLDGVSEDEEDRLKERLPRKYNFAETSGLKLTITEGDNTLQEIALK